MDGVSGSLNIFAVQSVVENSIVTERRDSTAENISFFKFENCDSNVNIIFVCFLSLPFHFSVLC